MREPGVTLHQFSERLDGLIEFGNPFAAGYRRPESFRYGKGNMNRNDHPEWIDHNKGEIGTHYSAKDMSEITGKDMRKGAVIYPNKGASAEMLKWNPDMKRTYGTPGGMSKSIRRHELMHNLRDFNGARAQKMSRTSKPARFVNEAIILKRELLGKRAKSLLKTPARSRLTALVKGLSLYT